MLFPKAVALLFLSLIQLGASIPATLEDRESACIALGDCPGENNPPPPPPPPPPPSTTTPPPAPTPTTFGCFHGADPDGAEGICPSVAATGWCICSDSSTYAITTGLPGGPCAYTAPPPSGPTTLPTADCSPSAPSATAVSTRSFCSQAICPKLCNIGSPDVKRSFDLENVESGLNGLHKRFYEDPNANLDTFPYGLLAQPYTRNICPPAPLRNTYIWKPFTNRQSAGGLQGLCGCTTIFVLSHTGAFSSHIWEQDEANTPPRDLQPANYLATMQDLTTALQAQAGNLAGGQAFIILPLDPGNQGQFLYGQQIVQAIQNTVQGATGIVPQTVTYIPLDSTDDTLGSNRRGTAAYQYDPNFNNNGVVGPAYRVFSESNLLSQQTW